MEFKRHRFWDDIAWVVGYIDAYGVVHGKVVFAGMTSFHMDLFPNSNRYKTWRWSKTNGLEKSSLCAVNPDEDDLIAVQNWLFKNGCLNEWEVPE